MRTRETPRVFDCKLPLGRKNLVVGGCSFTYNISDTDSSHWPYYVRDRLGFEQVYDCSLPGAGNYHIGSSIQWAVETEDFDPADTFVIVMWSGNYRFSGIGSPAKNPSETWSYNYTDSAVYYTDKTAAAHKSYASIAVENYLYISSLWNYLSNKGIPFMFLDYLDRSIANRSFNEFDIKGYLPEHLQARYKSFFSPVETIYSYAVKNDLLYTDDFHPDMAGHLAWTDHCLVPYIQAHRVILRV